MELNDLKHGQMFITEFKDLKYGQMFTVASDPSNVWVKIPSNEKLINALLLTNDDDDAVFEFFADNTVCDCLRLEYEEDEEDGGVDPRLAE